ncbi:DUF5069 domain-containing protein [Candidatus Poribacteria bacterium]|nr:DUF5069 domain-containing protein [Candidatus Poribacteria bacterium]
MAIQTDLTLQKPRGIRNKDVAGIYGVARMADKARAAYIGKLGGYQYGNASKQDAPILAFLGISAKDFQIAAVNNPNNETLSAWILETCRKTRSDIEVFNQKKMFQNQSHPAAETFTEHRRKIQKKRIDITSWIGAVWRWRLWFGK